MIARGAVCGEDAIARALDRGNMRAVIFFALLLCARAAGAAPTLARERYVLQTTLGDVTLALYDDGVAVETTEHIRKAFRMGLYATNHFFRVDKGFVAQIADASSGRRVVMSDAQRALAVTRVRGEFTERNQPRHARGRLSMARWDDPDSATSSFSVLLGDAPHLDGKYTVFGEVTDGEETLRRMEEVETRRDGIFVMPKERIEILATYEYVVENADGGRGFEDGACESELRSCRERADSLAKELHGIREKRLPGN